MDDKTHDALLPLLAGVQVQRPAWTDDGLVRDLQAIEIERQWAELVAKARKKAAFTFKTLGAQKHVLRPKP